MSRGHPYVEEIIVHQSIRALMWRMGKVFSEITLMLCLDGGLMKESKEKGGLRRVKVNTSLVWIDFLI